MAFNGVHWFDISSSNNAYQKCSLDKPANSGLFRSLQCWRLIFERAAVYRAKSNSRFLLRWLSWTIYHSFAVCLVMGQLGQDRVGFLFSLLPRLMRTVTDRSVRHFHEHLVMDVFLILISTMERCCHKLWSVLHLSQNSRLFEARKCGFCFHNDLICC